MADVTRSTGQPKDGPACAGPTGGNEKGPLGRGPFSGRQRAGVLAGDGDEGGREGEAQAHDEGGDHTVQEAFDQGETCESHDTHL